MANGSCDGGCDDGMEVESGVVVTSQTVFEQLLGFDGLQNDMEVEGEGRVVVTEVDEVEDIFFLLEEAFDEGKGVLERSGVEEGRRHCRRLVQRKLVGLVASVR